MTTSAFSSTSAIHLLPLEHIDEHTPMGGNLLPSGSGATFKVWAPAARNVDVLYQFVRDASGMWQHRQTGSLTKLPNGIWAGYAPGLMHGERYMFYVSGPEGGSEGLKRDPYARELTEDPMWPEAQCLLYNPAEFPWHDRLWQPPRFNDLCIYQFHIGTWYIPEGRHHGTFLDVIDKLPYLKSLHINAIQPLPIVEFPTLFNPGYNGVDYFAPESDYSIGNDIILLQQYLDRINRMLRAINPTHVVYTLQDIQGAANQFRMMVDMCHLYGIAILLDIVYSHAGGDFDDKSLYFFDRQPNGNPNNSLYFTDHEWAGGLVFAYWNDNVKQFLLDNARYYLLECHCDGLHYSGVHVIKNEGGEHGWKFCQYVTDSCHYLKPEAIHIAEHWPVDQALVSPTTSDGAGFDAIHNDGLRDAVRSVIQQAAGGAEAFVDMEHLAAHLKAQSLYDSWRAVQCVENHDIVRKDHAPRIAVLADGNNSRSWYGRSRSRLAMGLLATAPGIPHIFMGQEFLEDKPWLDEPGSPYQIWWDGLKSNKIMSDFLTFTQDLFGTRNRLPALRGTGLNVFHVHNGNRILAFQRCAEGENSDVVVVISLNESVFRNYELGFPLPGYWQEVFNSDTYDDWINPAADGNGGAIYADSRPLYGLPASAKIVIPANGILIFTR